MTVVSLMWLVSFRKVMGKNVVQIRAKIRVMDDRRSRPKVIPDYSRDERQAQLLEHETLSEWCDKVLEERTAEVQNCKRDIPTYAVYLVRFEWTYKQTRPTSPSRSWTDQKTTTHCRKRLTDAWMSRWQSTKSKVRRGAPLPSETSSPNGSAFERALEWAASAQ